MSEMDYMGDVPAFLMGAGVAAAISYCVSRLNSYLTTIKELRLNSSSPNEDKRDILVATNRAGITSFYVVNGGGFERIEDANARAVKNARFREDQEIKNLTCRQKEALGSLRKRFPNEK